MSSCPCSEIRKVWNTHQSTVKPWTLDPRDWVSNRCFQAEKERTEKPLPQRHRTNVRRQINKLCWPDSCADVPSHASMMHMSLYTVDITHAENIPNRWVFPYYLLSTTENILDSKFVFISWLYTDGLHRVSCDHLQFWDRHHYVEQYTR